MRTEYDLRPCDGRQSFYGKAKVVELNGYRYLYSYGTLICFKDINDKVHRVWDGWSLTTGRHIYAFCGLRKAEFLDLPLEDDND